MQLIADYFPLLLFFIAFKWQGIYVATAVAIVASFAQIAWLHWKRGRVSPVHWLSLAIIVVFGGATLILHDEVFIKWKPSVLYGLFGTALAVGRLGFGRNLIAYVMPGIKLPDAVWTRLTWSWVAFFAFMGIANWYVAFYYAPQASPEERLAIWVNFKVWGGIGLFLTFALAQGLFLSRHMAEESR
jgi:intracellular septation protein